MIANQFHASRSHAINVMSAVRAGRGRSGLSDLLFSGVFVLAAAASIGVSWMLVIGIDDVLVRDASLIHTTSRQVTFASSVPRSDAHLVRWL